MIEQIIEWDKALMLWLNELHLPWLDTLMVLVSHKLFWIPLYIVLLGWLIWKEKWQAVYLLVALALVITVADRFTSGFMKPFFERPRPCYDPQISNMVRNVGGCGGQYGFASSHAANVFGIAAFFWILYGRRYRLMALLFPWAILVSYSRIYLGVHYPTDITIGALVGIVSAWLILTLWFWVQEKLPPIQSLVNRRKNAA